MRKLHSSLLLFFLPVWLIILPGCNQTQAEPTILEQPEPTDLIHAVTENTLAPDISVLIEQATIFSTDFEEDFPLGIYTEMDGWEINTEPNGNSVFCNLPSDDWGSFTYGKDIWANYAVSLKMRVDPAGPDQFAELYFRINSSIDGYRAGIGDHEWANIGYYPPSSNIADTEVNLLPGEWTDVRVQVYGEHLEFYLNDELVIAVNDSRRLSGGSGVGASSGTLVCVDDILVWGLDENGIPYLSDPELVIEPFDGKYYSMDEKVANKRSLPVFYPWSGNCDEESNYYFNCDSSTTPYGLVWISAGIKRDIESVQPAVSPAQTLFMRSDPDTLYLISEEWHYWNTNWRYLSPESRFYLDEIYQFHIDSEYGDTKVINFTHPDWPEFLAGKVVGFQEAGFDGLMLDWWHNLAGNGRSPEIVQSARLEIIKAIRVAVGEDFILMGNVNWAVDDPTAQYLSGVFLELWKPDPAGSYRLNYSDEDQAVWDPSIERMEDLLLYWDQHLAWPKIIAFEPWKITTGDFITDRYSDINYQYAKLFTAMAVVIPENGYTLYADNNDDWDGGDHQHAYYDFYLTDLGKPISGMIEVADGVAYKIFQSGLVLYNRTNNKAEVEIPGGEIIILQPLTGLFIEE